MLEEHPQGCTVVCRFLLWRSQHRSSHRGAILDAIDGPGASTCHNDDDDVPTAASLRPASTSDPELSAPPLNRHHRYCSSRTRCIAAAQCWLLSVAQRRTATAAGTPCHTQIPILLVSRCTDFVSQVLLYNSVDKVVDDINGCV
jgi:hypothetical protein